MEHTDVPCARRRSEWFLHSARKRRNSMKEGADRAEGEQRAMKHTIHHEAFELVQQGEQAQPDLITEAKVLRLPEPMQRYLSHAQIVGKEPIRTVRLKQQGFMKQRPGQKWLHLVAEQYFTT